jgi:predicted DNA-binding protein (MmcQ/YjbR family)
MDIEWLREQCLRLKYVSEETPFGPEALVYKVLGKMFALIPIDRNPPSISLKNTPDKNIQLREEYEGIQGAYHMNKTHWNMLLFEYPLKRQLVSELIWESYKMVYESHPKKIKEANPLHDS